MEEESLEKKLNLPRISNCCPNCGSQERLGEQAIIALKEAGKLHKDSFQENSMMLPIPLLDMKRIPAIITAKSITVPVLQIYFDVCAMPECLTLYVTKFDLAWQEVPVQVQYQSPGPNLPGFLKG